MLASIGETYLKEEGLYQERLHIVALTGRFVGYLMQAYIDWCDFALEGLETWGDDDEAQQEWATNAMEQWLHEIGAR